MLMADTDTSWLEQHLLTCPSKKMFFLDCPGCGLQRSILLLIKGDFYASWQLYPPTVFIIFTLFVLLLHILFGFRHGALILKILFIITVTVIALNYIYKILNHQLL